MPSMPEEEAWARLGAARSGVLGTLHPERGPDLVPVVFVLRADRSVFVPIDTVKSKASTRLRRLTNIGTDPRCSLLIDHYDDDWTTLWWVRIHGRAQEAVSSDVGAVSLQLASRYEPYESIDSLVGGLVIDVDRIQGWTAVT